MELTLQNRINDAIYYANRDNVKPPELILMHPDTLWSLKNEYAYLGVVYPNSLESNNTYQGLRIIRSPDLKEDEIIVK